jgi:hypothetical protein
MPEDSVETIPHDRNGEQQSAASDLSRDEIGEEENFCWDGIPRVAVMP